VPESGALTAVVSGGGTGGHLYPALALLAGLEEVRKDIHPFFLGARRGLEARILPEGEVDHLLLPVQPFHRGAVLGNLAVLAGLLHSLFLAGEAFSRLRPGVVVVTGGYAGGPAGIVAGLMGVPLALQEQNAYPGITTRLLSRWAAQIHLAFPEARELLPARARLRARVSGNPIRPPVTATKGEARAAFGLNPKGSVVLVTGGSQGSAALNQGVLEMVRGLASGLHPLPQGLQLLWVTGPAHLEAMNGAVKELGNPGWVQLRGYTRNMPLAMRGASVAISRSGAMTTSELLAYGVPAILVPLPTSAGGHQVRNARSLEAAGAAIHLPEEALTGAALWASLYEVLSHEDRHRGMVEAALQRGRPQATRIIAEAVADLLPRAREVST
jgi:UDP-N-acetylglucosamine--N-acetylmuramyl-(pentapeptide) pyrophosphoryl-undecaprenol N-acetylglucosamine transferase